MAWAWYLANDMQFFIISPIYIYLLYRYPFILITLKPALHWTCITKLYAVQVQKSRAGSYCGDYSSVCVPHYCYGLHQQHGGHPLPVSSVIHFSVLLCMHPMQEQRVSSGLHV